MKQPSSKQTTPPNHTLHANYQPLAWTLIPFLAKRNELLTQRVRHTFLLWRRVCFLLLSLLLRRWREIVSSTAHCWPPRTLPRIIVMITSRSFGLPPLPPYAALAGTCREFYPP